MGNYNYKKDFKVARKTEKEVANILEKNCSLEVIGFGDSYRYDILAQKENGDTITFEVKEDFMCKNTGNVCLEFSCRGKDSGIATSEADYYIYKVHTKNGIKFLLHNIAELKNKVSHKEYFRIVNGGDEGSNSLSYLFKYDVFAKDARDITPKYLTK